MFQDEARFGRLPVMRAAWAPRGLRPRIKAAVQREFRYVYATISPFHGTVDWMTADMMNTEHMNAFLAQVAQKYRQEEILMVADGASSHCSKTRQLPPNVELLMLPPYSPELNPVENLWDYLRKHACGNRYFENLGEVVKTVDAFLHKFANGRRGSRKMIAHMFCWPWMKCQI